MNEIKRYFKYRQSLIDQYIKGDMTKAEYLERNLDAVLSLRTEPFKYMDAVEKALFNYQFYNAMAKSEKNNQLYEQKDRATLAVLKLLDFQDTEAYFIHTRSRQLNGKLFEILIKSYDMILHSASQMILNKLRSEGVFYEETRISLIDGYINQKY